MLGQTKSSGKNVRCLTLDKKDSEKFRRNVVNQQTLVGFRWGSRRLGNLEKGRCEKEPSGRYCGNLKINRNVETHDV